MKHYFLIAKDVGDLTRVLCAVLEDQQKKRSLFRLPGLALLGTKVEGFQVDQGRITVDEDAFRTEPLKLLRIFAEAQEHDLDIHPQALRFISKSLNLIGHEFRQDPQANAIFMRVMTSRKDPRKRCAGSTKRAFLVNLYLILGVLSHKCNSICTTPIQWMNTPSGR